MAQHQKTFCFTGFIPKITLDEFKKQWLCQTGTAEKKGFWETIGGCMGKAGIRTRASAP
jgi:hypothetical protein